MRRFLSLSLGALVLASVAVASSGGATQAEARWVITDLGTVGKATAINERGQIVGLPPFLWDRGDVISLGPGPEHTKEDFVLGIAINERGQVAIQQGAGHLARVWEDGELRTLEALDNANSSDAYAINDAGLIVGRSGTTGGARRQAVVWRSGENATALPLLPGGRKSEALGVNNRGVIVGWSANRRRDRAPVVWRGGRVVALKDDDGGLVALGVNERGQIFGRNSSYPARGVSWKRTKPTDLGSLGGELTFPYAINNRGQIVGESELGAGSKAFFHAFLWEAGRMRDLGALGGRDLGSIAYDVNDRSQVVGESRVDKWYGHVHAFVWEGGKMTDLGTLPGDKWSAALAINERGQIVGWSESRSGKTRAVLWTLKR